MTLKTSRFANTLRITLVILACAGLTNADAASAQQKGEKATPIAEGGLIPQTDVRPEPETTTASFGDWLLKCQKAQSAEKSDDCEVIHSVLVQGQSAPILQLAVGKSAGTTGQQLVVVLPTNVLLSAKPAVGLDGSEPALAAANWLRCIPGACFAQVPVDTSRWLSAERGVVKYFDAANRELAIPFSFRGLKQALEALGKS